MEITQDFSNVVPRYVEKVDCNPKYPQNHNLAVTNLRSDSVDVYVGDRWITKSKRETLDAYVDQKIEELSRVKDTPLVQTLPPLNQKHLRFAINDEELAYRLPKKVEKLLYSYRDLINKTRKQRLQHDG